MTMRRGFTLVEALVAVAMIALLVGLLVPGLGGAREKGREAVCAANARSLHSANLLFARDYEDRYAPSAKDRVRDLNRWHGARANASEAFTPDGGALTPYLNGGTGARARSETDSMRACPSFAAEAEALRESGVGFERGAGGYGYNNAFVGLVRVQTTSAGAPGASAALPGTGWTIETDEIGAPMGRFAHPARTIGFADGALASARPEGPAGGLAEYSLLEAPLWPDWPAPPGAAGGAVFRADPSMHFRHGGRREMRASIAWLDGRVSLEARGFTWSSGVYPADAAKLRLGWPGTAEDNSLFDYE